MRNSAITVRLNAQVGQGELGQQRDGALAGVAQVAAHADDAVEGGVDERAGVEAVRGQGMFGLALRAVAGAMSDRGQPAARCIVGASRRMGVGSA